ncbi:MAG: diguanylate cyclase [Chloroflexi bacterium]|nr:diguanylate cyclase [Chloroflexota bacterium]
MKILLVEDEHISRQMVKKILLKAGHEVVEAEDGQAAWELFQREPFQFVITDWMMPRLDGPSLVQHIRSSDQKSYTYIVLLTAMDDKDNVVSGLESGADEYLTKPFNNKELIARVASGIRILNLEEQLIQARQQMEQLALHDGLTGLLNRRAIEEYAEAEFDQTSRKKRPLSVVLLDVDHFKSVNDKYGHKFGDHTLRRVAQLLTGDLRKYDRVGRWGGEEFILILPETQLQDAIMVAERLRSRIADMKLSLENGKQFSVQISLGVACTTGEFPSLQKLIDAADQAMYRAKQTGRNRVCSSESAH